MLAKSKFLKRNRNKRHTIVLLILHLHNPFLVGGRQKAAKREITRIIIVDISYKGNSHHKRRTWRNKESNEIVWFRFRFSHGFGTRIQIKIRHLSTMPRINTILLQCRYVVRYKTARHTKCQYHMRLIPV